MYTLQKITDKDLEFIEKYAFILALQIRWCGDFDRRYTGAVVDEDGETAGVFALSFHSTWYCDSAPENKVVFNYIFYKPEVLPELVKGARSAFEQMKADFPQKKAILTAYIEAKELDETQLLLQNGFCFKEVVPVLKYDIPEEVKQNTLPDGITIERVGKTDEEIDEYLAATAEANDGVGDSKAEYMFRSGDESFLSFKAVHDGKTVGGISVWNIGEDRCASENIFTIPTYRKKGIATALIMTVCEEIKRRGSTMATLSMLGSNAAAMRLYQEIGYKLSYYLIELRV